MECTIKPCTTKGGLSVKPKGNVKIELEKLKKHYDVLIDTPIVVVIKHPEAGEIIVHRYGELIFKECEDQELIQRIAEEIYQ